MTTSILSLKTAGVYSLAECLGYNGVVATYKAQHRDTKEPACVVALDQNSIVNPPAWNRFVEEFSSFLHTTSPFLCRPLNYGVEQGNCWAAYQYLKGSHLGAEVRDNGLPTALRSMEIGFEVLQALQALHGQRCAHRMLTPVSIFLGESGDVKLLHVGWSWPILGVDQGPANPAFISSLPFLAPEIAFGGEGDEASDVYSLGSVLYFILTGMPTHWAGDPQELLGLMRSQPVDFAPLGNALPPEGVALLEDMLQPDPLDRPVNLEALRERFLAVLQSMGSTSASAAPAAAPSFEPERPIKDKVFTQDGGRGFAGLGEEEEPPPMNEMETVVFGGGRGGPGAQAAEPEPDPLRQLAAPMDQGARGFHPDPTPTPQRQPAMETIVSPHAPEAPRPSSGSRIAAPPSPPPSSTPHSTPASFGTRGPKGVDKKVLLAASVGGGILLLIVVAVLAMALSGGDSEPAPAPPTPRTPRGGAGGATARGESPAEAAEKYVVTAETLSALHAHHMAAVRRYGTWDLAIKDLVEVGADPNRTADGWGTPVEIWDDFLMSAGPDKKWETQDDLWVDSRQAQLGGWSPNGLQGILSKDAALQDRLTAAQSSLIAGQEPESGSLNP